MTSKSIFSPSIALLALSLAGCAATPSSTHTAPAAAPTAIESRVPDLEERMLDAEWITVTGHLAYFSVAAQEGVFFTWSLNPAGPMRPCELDVRNCIDDARRLENQKVIVVGKLIPRQPRHLNLIVVQHIFPKSSPHEIAQLDATDSFAN